MTTSKQVSCKVTGAPQLEIETTHCSTIYTLLRVSLTCRTQPSTNLTPAASRQKAPGKARALWSRLRAPSKAEVASSTLALQLPMPGAERTGRIYIRPADNDLVHKQSSCYTDKREKTDPFLPLKKPRR